MIKCNDDGTTATDEAGRTADQFKQFKCRCGCELWGESSRVESVVLHEMLPHYSHFWWRRDDAFDGANRQRYVARM